MERKLNGKIITGILPPSRQPLHYCLVTTCFSVVYLFKLPTGHQAPSLTEREGLWICG